MTDLSQLLEKVRTATAGSRFEEHVFPEPMSGCWLWIGPAYSDRGRLRPIFSLLGKNHLAHRVSKVLYHGAFPDKAYICHHCDNPMCVNPDHLYVGDHQSNMADMARRKRSHFSQRPDAARAAGIAIGKANTWARGSGNPKAKLTPAAVIDIRKDARPRRVIAAAYGVDGTTIHRIKTHKLWASVISKEKADG